MWNPRWTIGRGMVAILVVGLTLGLLRVSDPRVIDVVSMAAYLLLLAATFAAIQPSGWRFLKGYAIFAWLPIGALVAARWMGWTPGRLICALQQLRCPARPPLDREVADLGSLVFGVLDVLCGMTGGIIFRGLARARGSRMPQDVARVEPL